MIRTLPAIALATLAAVLALPATAQLTGHIQAHHPFAWIAPAGTSGAAYARLYNTGAQDDRIVAASSPSIRTVEIHNHTIGSDGVARMHRIRGGIALPAGAAVDLAPGGPHLMLMGLRESLSPGEAVEITLMLESGDELQVRATVLQRGSTEGVPMDHGHHGEGTEMRDHQMDDSEHHGRGTGSMGGHGHGQAGE